MNNNPACRAVMLQETSCENRNHRVFVAALALVLCASPGCGRSRESGDAKSPESLPARSAAAAELVEARNHMVETQISHPRDRRQPVVSESVLAALRAVPRHAFVSPELRPFAYDDRPLPIGAGQTISQPYIVALVTEQLALSSDSKVLEIGVGSGYQAAVLAEITSHVFGIEIVRSLAEGAERTLREQGYTNVRLRHGDGFFGWKEEAPFDGIIVSCAAEKIPPPLWEQLRVGGRIVIPVGDPRAFQELVVVTKLEGGEKSVRRITDVRFVPLTGAGESDSAGRRSPR